MIDRCSRCHGEFNPRLAREGDFYALRRHGNSMEHFWLCLACARDHTLRLDGQGRMEVTDRRPDHGGPISPDADMQVIFRIRRPPQRSAPYALADCSGLG